MKRKFIVNSPTGNVRLLLTTQKNGFSLWDIQGAQWILDASEIKNDGIIRITTPQHSKDIHDRVCIKRIAAGEFKILNKETTK